MPTGPGDEILDAIETGMADDQVLTKYKISPDQLKSFKSLHYGLINRRIAYDDIGSYFPDLETYFKPAAPVVPTAPAAPEQPKVNKTQASVEKINKALISNDDVVESMIREGRYRQDVERRLNEFAGSARSDSPAAGALALERLRVSEPEVKPQDLPVTTEDITQTRQSIHSDEQQARHFLSQVIKKKPEQAKDIQRSLYELDASQRAESNEETMKKVQGNLEKLEKGELKYDPKTGRLIEEQGFFDSLISGVKERTRQLDRYEKYQGDNKSIIEMLEADRAAYDPDKPIETPTGIGELGQMTGMEWMNLLKGGAVAGTVGRVAPPVVTAAITSAISSPEYYKRGYVSAFEETYNQLRNEGKDEETALRIAQQQAADEGAISAAEGAVSSFVGAKMGLKPLPKYNITSGFKNAAANVLKNTARYAADQTIDGLADGLVAGYLQEEKNKAAEEKGIFRATGEGIKENVVGEITFSLALGAVTKVGSKIVDPKTYKKLLYWLGKQPPETVDAKIGEMVADGQITPEDAQEAKEQIDAQRELDKKIPENIKDVSRQAMADKIKRRQELEKQLESVDEALHPPLKEEIKKLNEEILEHSTHVKPEDEQANEVETSEQPTEGVASTEEQVPPGTETMGLEETVPGADQPTSQQESQQVPPEVTDQSAITEESSGARNTGAPPPTKAQKEFYESSIGGTPNPLTGRIPISPIVGESQKKVKDIIKDVSVGLKQRLIYAKPGRRAIGAYFPSFKGIKIRYNNDLDTTAHELGHSIDDEFDIYTEAAKDPDILAEWEALAQHGGSQPPANHPDPARYIQKEGFAEWLRGFIVNPQEAERVAPKTTALYKSLVNEKFQKVIENFSTDIRTWAGSEGKDITMANVEFKPEKIGLLNDLFKKEQTNNNFRIGWWSRLAANFINPLHAFEKAFKYAKGIQGDPDVLPENDPIILSRILNGIDGKFGELLKTGMVDGRNNILKDANGEVMNLNWLLSAFDNTDLKTIERDMYDTIAYMISERVENDLSKRFQKGDIISGAGAGIYSDFQVAQKTLNEFYNGDPNRLQRIQEAARRYREFSKSIMQYAVDKGRMSQKAFDEIVDNNEYYVAMQRILETEPGEELIGFKTAISKKLGSTADIIHRLKGSTKEIKNPYATLLDTMYKTIRESDRNDVLRAFTDMLQNPRFSNTGTLRRLSDIGIKGTTGDKETIPVYRNGKAERWIFQKDVYKQLKGLDKDAYRLNPIVTILPRMLRAFTTQFPTFAVRNWIRDLQDRLIKTTTGSGFSDLVGRKEEWHAIARAGGLNTGHYFKDKQHYFGLMWEAMDEMAKNKKFILADPIRLKAVWHKYQDLLYRSETSNRVAEYRAALREAKKNGMDDYNAAMYAAYKARDLIDFAIMGHYMKIINQIVPFSNAALQGLRSAVVSFRDNPATFAGRLALYSVAPSVAAWFWNHRNEEDEKQYEELPSYVRDMFWNFHVGPNKWLSIPKPYELALPAAGVDRALSKYLAGHEKAFDGYIGSARKLLIPFDEGNFAGPFQGLVEGMTNYDFFRERTIIPPDEDPLNLALRHTETASRLGQTLQDLTGIDGRKIDHFIKRQFSYTGSTAIKLSDLGKEDSRHKFDLTDTGLFKRSPAYNAKSVQEMISFAKEWGLTRTPPYKGFNQIVGAYFAAETDEEREAIADEMINYSKNLLEAWQKEAMEKRQEERAEAKKAQRR